MTPILPPHAPLHCAKLAKSTSHLAGRKCVWCVTEDVVVNHSYIENIVRGCMQIAQIADRSVKACR